MTVTASTAAAQAAPSSVAAGRAPGGAAPVVVSSALGVAALLVDAVSGEGRLGLVGVALLSLALAGSSLQVVRARVGRPQARTRLAARTAAGSSLFVATFLSAVGVVEQTGPEAVQSPVFAAGVAVTSVVLLVVLPLALVVLARGVAADQRLRRQVRLLPSAVPVVVAAAGVAVAVTDGRQELWACVVAGAAAGAALTGLSVGLSGVRSRGVLEDRFA